MLPAEKLEQRASYPRQISWSGIHVHVALSHTAERAN